MSIEADSHITIADMAAQLQPSDGWKEPVMFGLSEHITQPMVAEAARQSGAGVVDEVEVVFDSLFKLRYPDKMHDGDAKAAFMHEQGARRNTYGTSVYFPWLHKVVRYADEADHYALTTTRNQNAISLTEQDTLREQTILVAGLSVGSNVDDAMMRLGMGNKRIYADMDRIEPINFNRMDANMSNAGGLKVDLQATKTSLRNPYLKQVHFPEGVTRDNIEAIFAHEPGVVVDEVDDIAIKALLRLHAKWRGIPVLMGTDVDRKSVIDVERYDIDKRTVPFDGRISPAQFMALVDGTMSPEEQRKLTLKIVGLRNVSARMLSSAAGIGKTLSGMPQLGTTASTTGNLVAETAAAIFLGQPVKSGRHTGSVKKILGLKSAEGPLDFIRALQEFAHAGKASAAN